jgi:hypothetical protein
MHSPLLFPFSEKNPERGKGVFIKILTSCIRLGRYDDSAHIHCIAPSFRQIVFMNHTFCGERGPGGEYMQKRVRDLVY